jgi:predicted metalloprotease with PDZ domain
MLPHSVFDQDHMIGSLLRLARLARITLLLAIVRAAAPAASAAQSPLRHWTEAIDSRFAVSQPVISYVLRVDSADLAGFQVSMTVRGATDTTMLGMVAHPEYDDQYWRFVRDVRVEAASGRATVTRADSALWRVVGTGGSFVVRYRLVLPAAENGDRAAWKPFLTPTGGLVGGTQSFMYVVGQTLVPSHVMLDVPASWTIATGLVPTADRRTFYAPSVAVLTESPMLIGRLRDWRFSVDGVPHRVAYWPRPDAVPFDTGAVISGIERLVRGAVALFGRPPYREYLFAVQDGAYGALEHANSVTLGAPSRELATGLAPFFGELAHEYFHAWNLMRIHPAEYGDVSYRTPPRSRGLWFSEGLSMFYSDLLRRRAGIPASTPTRVGHLESIIGRYFANPGNGRLSAERVSQAEYGNDPGALGDYFASTHLQGELIGAMLDLEIRHASGGRRSMDDVMRLMLQRFSGERGFTGRDVERVVAEVCGCNVTPFFDAHVRGGQPIPFDHYLRFIGLRVDVSWQPALGNDGRPAPDLRAFPYEAQDGSGLRLRLSDPASAWGRAGLHTGDRIRAVNGQPVPNAEAMVQVLRHLESGDTLRVDVEHDGVRRTATVVMAPVNRPVVHLRAIPNATAAERAQRDRWEAGAP